MTLQADEKAHIDACAADCSEALQFAQNSWWYIHEDSRPWTSAMRTYRDELSAKWHSDPDGIDYDAAFPRGNRALLGRKTR